jgi:hypothetical protein
LDRQEEELSALHVASIERHCEKSAKWLTDLSAKLKGAEELTEPFCHKSASG